MTKICPACATENGENEEYCLNCGQRLIESEDKEIVPESKLPIPTDKIILLDLNYSYLEQSLLNENLLLHLLEFQVIEDLNLF